jgi:hypothetical protein
MIFCLNPAENIDSPKLIEFISLNPYVDISNTITNRRVRPFLSKGIRNV